MTQSKDRNPLIKENFPQKVQSIIDAMEGVRRLGGEKYGDGGKRNPVKDDAVNFLVALVLARRPKIIFEIGTAYGFSALCFALANTDTSVVTVENDPDVAELARQTFNNAGLADRYTVVTGSVHEAAAELSTGVDMVFIDHHPDRYLLDFRAIEPHLTGGAVILADNVTDLRYRSGIDSFVEYIFDKYESTVILPTKAGLLCSSFPESGSTRRTSR